MTSLESHWAASEIEHVNSCVACGSEHLLPLHRGIQDIEEGVPGDWTVDICSTCQTLYLNPRLTEAAIGNAYSSYYTHTAPIAENEILNSRSVGARIANGYLTERYGTPCRGTDFPGMLARMAWPLRQQLDYFMRLLPCQAGRLLDVGCGSGGFLQRASLAGWEVEGIEPDPSAARLARSSGLGRVYESLDQIDTRFFDVVTLSHVIEHVHRPDQVLKECFNLLKPQGRIWIATPNIGGYGHRKYGKDWQALEVPRHLVMPSATALHLMLQKAGFERIEFQCRGRGSAKRFKVNEQRSNENRRGRFIPLQSFLVDLHASFSAYAGEDLVVTASKPE